MACVHDFGHSQHSGALRRDAECGSLLTQYLAQGSAVVQSILQGDRHPFGLKDACGQLRRFLGLPALHHYESNIDLTCFRRACCNGWEMGGDSTVRKPNPQPCRLNCCYLIQPMTDHDNIACVAQIGAQQAAQGPHTHHSDFYWIHHSFRL